MNIFKEDNHINIRFLGIKIEFKNPFVDQLEDCCSIHNLKDLKRKGTIFPHPIGIVIAKDAQIGKDCVIYQNVTPDNSVVAGNPARIIRSIEK